MDKYYYCGQVLEARILGVSGVWHDAVMDVTCNEHSGLFVGSLAVSQGTVGYMQLRSNLFRRVLYDVYGPPDLVVTHEILCIAASMIAPPEAMLTGRSAAVMYGVPLATASDLVELCVPEKHRFGPTRGIRLHRGPIKEGEYVHWNGIRMATPRRMALDLLLRQAPRTATLTRRLRTAVADVDQILRAGLVTVAEIGQTLVGRRDWGVRVARQALDLVDSRAESPPESHVRVILAVAGIAACPQYEVWHRGRLLGRLDLAYPESRIAVEYDGRWHEDGKQPVIDRQRRESLRALGWRFVIVRDEDLLRPQEIVDAVRGLLRARSVGPATLAG